MTNRPCVVGRVALFAGYFAAFARRADRAVSRELMRFHRSEQMQKLKTVISTLCRFKKIDTFELLPIEHGPARVTPTN